MQTLRKKTSPLKYKNETSRFLGEGVSFKAKLIGILEVSEARGDRMCQEALSDLKMAIRAAGEHKQRITMNIAIDGLRLRDEKTGDSLYHHPVHKISFIAQDMTDSRAFGYIFGSPDTGHRFFGIKTDKAASQVVIAMRDLFQVVFALKRKEIEVAKQNLDKNRFGASSIFPDNSISNVLNKSLTGYHENATSKSSVSSETKPDPQVAVSERKASSPMLVSLLDLELELNSLQQGISQMERITPSESGVGKGDPFGDSFTEFSAYPKPILPPPPSGRDRSSRLSESGGKFSPKAPDAVDPTLDRSTARDGPESNGWFAPSVGDKLFEEPPLVPDQPTKDRQHEQLKHEIMAQFDVFTELDPLGTGKTKPYVDKKHFFQELKNPPKRVLNDLMEKRSSMQSGSLEARAGSVFNSDPFGEDPFDQTDPFSDSDPFDTASFTDDKNLTPLFSSGLSRSPNRPGFVLDKQASLSGDRSPKAPLPRQNTFDGKFNNGLSSVGENEDVPVPEPPPRPAAGNFVQIKPPPLPPKKLATDAGYKPPPRPPYADEPNYDYIGSYESSYKMSCDESPPLPAPSRKAKPDASAPAPERPRRQPQPSQSSDEDYLTPISFPKLQINIAKHRGPVLLPPPQRAAKKQNSIHDDTKATDPESLEGLDITLSQLTLSGLNELATKLNIPANQLSNMTLVQLTAYISDFIRSQRGGPPDFREDFADFDNFNTDTDAAAGDLATVEADRPDRYAVFRELLGDEIGQTRVSEPEDGVEEEGEKLNNLEGEVTIVENGNATDRYAALREIVETEIVHTLITDNDNRVADADKENNVAETDKEDQENETMESSGTTGVAVDDRKELISPPADTESNQISAQAGRLTSGSLSDIVSGSSPEIDASEVVKKSADTAGESWAVFADAPKQSEEGVSPWSSDSKEFGNGSPPEWTTVRQGWGRPKQEQEEWWDAAEDIVDDSVQVSRRSLDSYEDEGYDRYGHPLMSRRKQPSSSLSWGSNHERQPTAGGGHSSSSRDVSPWEEEPRRREHWEARERKDWQAAQPPRHSRQSSFERQQRPRRHADSWDEEDDYEYDEERSGRYHWPECHCPRDIEKDRGGTRDRDWIDERRHYRRKDVDWDKYCCPDWESEEMDHRYRWSYRKYGSERYYGRWEDGQEDPQQHYLTTKPRNWKQRPSSASEMDRKSGENKNWPGGSDGERDRRYRANRRSRSRDSQLAEPAVYGGRHKPDPSPTLRGSHRAKAHQQHQAEDKPAAMFPLRKKPAGKSEEQRAKVLPARAFENNFAPSDTDSPAPASTATKFAFENDFETSEADSPIAAKPPTKKAAATTAKKTVRHKTLDLDHRREPKKDVSMQRTCQKSPFEDDFSPPPPVAKKEEEAQAQPEEPISVMRRKLVAKGRFPGGAQDGYNLKKSESINIFVRESDPFDDEFFSGEGRKGGEYKWSEDFEDYDLDENN